MRFDYFCAIIAIASAFLLQTARASDFHHVFAVEHGRTTFRSQIIRADAEHLVIPSEGVVAGRGDSLEGVRVYRLADGALVRPLVANASADVDRGVRGVLIADEVAFWGDASGQVVAQNWKTGEHQWSAQLRADVESAPVRLATTSAGDGAAMVVFATKAYGVDRRAEVFAFDLASGTEHWRFRADSPGDFMASPLAVDLNADGYDDVVLGNGNNGWQPRPGGDGEYGSTLYALDGRTGAVLWQRRFGSGQHARVVQAHGSLWVTESYGQFTRLSLKGEQEASWSLSRHEAVGVFATPVLTRGGRLVVGSSTWGGFPDALWSLPVLGDGQTSTQPAPGRIFNELMGGYRVGTGRISASAVLDGDRVWVVTEDGALIELRESAEGLPVSRIHGLPAGSECPPLIIAQGASETRTVIVAGNDGMLRCFKLGQ